MIEVEVDISGRFIGLIYRPDTERWNHYSEAILPRRRQAPAALPVTAPKTRPTPFLL